MIVELEIENLALIERARIPFGQGLNALTGETGSGKTLVLRALEIIRGARADKEWVREGAGECRVSALVRMPEERLADLTDTLDGVEVEDGELILARVISRDGRSRCYANGRLIPLSQLRAIGALWIDVLGQGESRHLHDAGHRAGLVDAFGNLYQLHAHWLAARERALTARERRDRLIRETLERRQRLDFLRFQRDEIDAVAPRAGEQVELEQELAVLDAAEELAALCREALDLLYEGEESVNDRLARLLRRADAVDPGARHIIAGATEALVRAAAEVDESAAGFRAASDRANDDPARRAELDERLSALRRLLDRYGPSEDRLIAHRATLDAEILALEDDEDATENADAAVATSEAELLKTGAELDAARAREGRKLAKKVQAELRLLGMEHAEFSIALVQNAGAGVIERAQISGPSTVEYLLRANVGHAEKPLAVAASGGEAARIALALRAALSSTLDVPVLVFDEIESAVGSRLGEVVARCLRTISRQRQVLVVTHLAPVAAYADHHLRVGKEMRDGLTTTSVAVLLGEAREAEIAAMIRGEGADGTTHREARALLKSARGQAT